MKQDLYKPDWACNCFLSISTFPSPGKNVNLLELHLRRQWVSLFVRCSRTWARKIPARIALKLQNGLHGATRDDLVQACIHECVSRVRRDSPRASRYLIGETSHRRSSTCHMYKCTANVSTMRNDVHETGDRLRTGHQDVSYGGRNKIPGDPCAAMLN